MRYLLMLFFNLLAACCLAQDIHFSQPYLAPLALNPSLTGIMTGNLRLVANVRRQGNSVVGNRAYEHAHFSFDARICLDDGSFLAFGLMMQGDRAGNPSISNNTAALAFAYHGKMRKDLYFSAGASAGILNYKLDTDGMSFDEQFGVGGYSPALPHFEDFETDSRIQPDLSAGLLLFGTANGGWLLGGALQHINQPAYSFYDKDDNRLGMGFTLHGAKTFILSTSGERSKVTIRGAYRRQSVFQNSKQWQLYPGTTWRYGIGKSQDWGFGAGLSCRLSGHTEGKPATFDAVVPSVLFDYEDWSIGLSYDVNTSSLASASGLRGGWEVAVKWQLQRKMGCVLCPNM